MFGLFWWDWTILIVIPGMLFTLWAQYKVRSGFARYSRMPLAGYMTGAAVARRMLDSNGLSHVPVEMVSGHLSDHYDPRHKVLRLSQSVYHGSNVAAVGVAAHEAGHALQDAKGYVPLRFRIAIVPACNIGSRLAMPLFFIGLLLASDMFMTVGILAYAAVTLFQLITLPVEFNASRRAMQAIASWGYMSADEQDGSRRVLRAAAMTYVAALATSLLTLLRLLVLFSDRRGRR